jgi:hypothetical protein
MSDQVESVRLTEKLGELLKLKSLAMRSHYSCEDRWYSCPKSADGCSNDDEGDECNCGADKHNAEVDALFQEMLSAPNAGD